ncbi:MAG: septum formation protein Maf [Myxococcales bacterium]|nr:septum formation protein Maf [Myxococcales bacterium]
MPSFELILASASPRRAALLAGAGLDFERLAVDCDESWHPGEAPVAYARRVARAKAEAVVAALADREHDRETVVLAADTTVWLDADRPPLAKPADRDEARTMLRSLCAGRPHQVTTACVFASSSGHGATTYEELVETTLVRMRHLEEPRFSALIEPYLDGDEWCDKAGAYAIQGFAAALVEGIEGSYTTVVGLPLAQVVIRLEQLGITERTP